MPNPNLKDVRCQIIVDGKQCNRLLGKIDGEYEIKCPRCKGLTVSKPYDKVKGE